MLRAWERTQSKLPVELKLQIVKFERLNIPECLIITS